MVSAVPENKKTRDEASLAGGSHDRVETQKLRALTNTLLSISLGEVMHAESAMSTLPWAQKNGPPATRPAPLTEPENATANWPAKYAPQNEQSRLDHDRKGEEK
jgi:hypothetical protein